MAKHIGIVACSAEGAALCYRTICVEGADLMGEHAHPEITMHTHPLSIYKTHFDPGDWKGVADLMVDSAKKVALLGADFAICPDNTIHQAFDRVMAQSPIPWLHIAETVAEEARRQSHTCIGVLGTRYLMEGPVYPEKLKEKGLAYQMPTPEEREQINTIIFNELVYGQFLEPSRQYFCGVIDRLKSEGCDAVVLGCTEIPLLIPPDLSPLPTLDSTRLLAHFCIE